MRSYRLSITWSNKGGAKLVDARLINRLTRAAVPLPIREGGLAYESGGFLCLPRDAGLASMVYTFEPPAGFPAGEYLMEFWAEQARQPEYLPLRLLCQPAPVPAREVPANNLYPLKLVPIVSLWSENWFYKNTRLDGYRFLPPVTSSFYYSYAGGKAGKYRLTVRGSGHPAIVRASPDPVWPKVEILAPGDAKTVLAAVAVASEKTGRFSVDFDVPRDFDFLVLRPALRNGQPMPLMPPNFAPADYGTNALDFRGVFLEKIK